MLRRTGESAFVSGPSVVGSPAAGARVRCEVERQGDSVRRELYVARVPDEKTRASLTDSFVACLQLRSEHVLPFVDAGSFGEHVYGAMAITEGTTLSRLLDPLAGMSSSPARIAERGAILAAIAEGVALGLEAGHAHAGKGLVHDALDLDSIHVDSSGHARVDAAFLDPWIAAATIPASAARFVAAKRWTPPAKIASDVAALAAILAELAKDDVDSKIAAFLRRTAKGEGPATLSAFVAEVRAAAETDVGQALLGELVAAEAGPPSHTQIGVGLLSAARHGAAGLASRADGPVARRPATAAMAQTLPRIQKDDEKKDDAPPRTQRFGFLGEDLRPASGPPDADGDDESDATIVEPLRAFDIKADDKTPIARVPAARIPLARAAVGASRDAPRPAGGTLSTKPATAAKPAGPPFASGAGAVASGAGGPPFASGAGGPARGLASASEKTPIAMDIPTAAQSMRGRLGRELEADEEDGSTVVAPLWSEAMARATRDDHEQSGDTRTRRERIASQRRVGEGAKSPKVVPIPSAPPVPVARPSRPGERSPRIGNLPNLWSDEAAPESEELATIASPLVPEPAPSGPLVSYALERAALDEGDEAGKSAHEVTTARGPVHVARQSSAHGKAEAAAAGGASRTAGEAPLVDPPAPRAAGTATDDAALAAKPVTRSMEPTPPRGTIAAEPQGKLPVGWMIAAFVVAAGLVAVIALLLK